MFTAKPMTRLLIAAAKEHLNSVIEELYRLRACHIEEFLEHEDAEGFRIGEPLERATDASSDLIALRAIENTCGIRPADVKVANPRKAGELSAVIDRDLPIIQQEVESLVSKRQHLETQLRESEQRIRELEPFVAIPLNFEMYRGYDGFTVLAGRISRDIDLTVPHEKFVAAEEKRPFIVVIFPNEYREDVERQLIEVQFQGVGLPDGEGSPQAVVDACIADNAAITSEIEGISRRIEELRDQYTEFIAAADEMLTLEVEKAEAPLRFATSDESFVIEGWVPSARVDEFREGMISVTGGRVFVTDLEIEEDAKVPVEYNNPHFAHPTELLIDAYSRPRYSEIDPTLLVSIIFPLFFGFILGDVGYGAVLLGASFAVRHFLKGETFKQIAGVLRNISISSIAFGVIFSEFFGSALPWAPLWFSRHLSIGGHTTGHGPAVAELMVASVWIGILHITGGRVLGMLNHYRQDHGSHRVKTVLGQAGWILAMWGILCLIWSVFPITLMPDLTGLPVLAAGISVGAIVGAVMAVAGIVFIARESVFEVIELPALISNVLSYARLVAVGFSSVAIAMVINFLAIGMIIEPQLEHFTPLGVVAILMGIVVLIMGHLLNTVLGLLGGGLHSIRLNYVEFFTKFYKGGGIKYEPFGMLRKLTEE